MQDLEFIECQKNDIQIVVEIINQAYRSEKKSKSWTTEGHLLDGKRVENESFGKLLKYAENNSSNLYYKEKICLKYF